MLTLEETNTAHSRMLAGGSGAGLVRKLSRGSYRVKISQATTQARKNAELVPPRTRLTIMFADADVEHEYNSTWAPLIDGCDSGSNFPLALRQQKQADIHQLYYDYPLVKVDPSVLGS
jgi:hypothetical protein